MLARGIPTGLDCDPRPLLVLLLESRLACDPDDLDAVQNFKPLRILLSVGMRHTYCDVGMGFLYHVCIMQVIDEVTTCGHEKSALEKRDKVRRLREEWFPNAMK